MSGEDLKAFIDGELPAWKRWLVARKIAKDPALQAEIEALRKLSNDLASLDLPEATLSEGLRTLLLATATTPDIEPPAVPAPTRRSPTKMLALGLVGASALAIIAVLFVPQPIAETQTEKAASREAAAPASTMVADSAPTLDTAKQQPAAMAPPAEKRDKAADATAEAMAGFASAAAPRVSATYADTGAKANEVKLNDRLGPEFKSDGGARFRYSAKLATEKPQAFYSLRNVAGTINLSSPGEVVELAANSDKESLSELRDRVEAAIKEYGGKVLKREPFEVSLPPSLRSTARQKLLALVVAQPEKEEQNRGRGGAMARRAAPKSQLKVTIYFRE